MMKTGIFSKSNVSQWIIPLVFLALFVQTGSGATWTGATDSDWNKSGNWNPSNKVPDKNDAVVIPFLVSPANYPEVSSAHTVGQLDIQAGAVLTVKSGGSLTVEPHGSDDGSITLNGTLTIEGGGVVYCKSLTPRNPLSPTAVLTIEENGALIIDGVPTSSGIDLRAFQASEGSVVEFVAYDVEEDGSIDLKLLGEDGSVVWSGSVDATAGPEFKARFLVPGLKVGKAYHFKVRDEVGKLWDAPNVTVGKFGAKMTSASLEGITLTFDSQPAQEYEVQWVPGLGKTWQTVTNLTASSAQTTLVVPHPDAEGPTGFFKILLK